MRLMVLGLAAALAAATPALADETRIELHGGGSWVSQHPNFDIGAGIGRDFTLAPATFVGVEASLDKILGSNAVTMLGLEGRAGLNVPVVGKLYAVSGYNTKPYSGTKGEWNLGLGVQKSIEPGAYIKLEYRHYFANDTMLAREGLLAGIGGTF